MRRGGYDLFLKVVFVSNIIFKVFVGPGGFFWPQRMFCTFFWAIRVFLLRLQCVVHGTQKLATFHGILKRNVEPPRKTRAFTSHVENHWIPPGENVIASLPACNGERYHHPSSRVVKQDRLFYLNNSNSLHQKSIHHFEEFLTILPRKQTAFNFFLPSKYSSFWGVLYHTSTAGKQLAGCCENCLSSNTSFRACFDMWSSALLGPTTCRFACV